MYYPPSILTMNSGLVIWGVAVAERQREAREISISARLLG